MGTKINGRFVLRTKLGAGTFGEVYRAYDEQYGDMVAVKMEPVTRMSLLEFEGQLMQYLGRQSDERIGFPDVRWRGVEDDYNIVVMDLLGPTLERLAAHCGGTFSPRTLCHIAFQGIDRLEYLHECSFIHRDMKPENFVFGTGSKSHHLYLIDFGLSKRYRDLKTHEHKPFKEGKMAGTVRYVSLNTHLGCEQSRRDDLESFVYMLIFLGSGSLPWMHVAERTKQARNEKIAGFKMATTPEVLCRDVPPAVLKMLVSVRGLDYDEEPPYDVYKQWFMEDLDHRVDYLYDWLPEELAQRLPAPADPFTKTPDDGEEEASEGPGIVVSTAAKNGAIQATVETD